MPSLRRRLLLLGMPKQDVARADAEHLLWKHPHILKAKGHRIRLEEIVADHAGEVEAKSVLPGERPIVETRDVVFLYVSEGKSTDGQGTIFSVPL